MTVAGDFLAKLFDRAQRSRTRGGATDRLLLSKAQCPAYFEMRDIQDAEAFRGELQAAVNAGAIVIEPLAGHHWPRDVQAITARDLGALARILGVRLLEDVMRDARDALSPHLPTHPVLNEVLGKWALGQTVRRYRAEQVSSLVDAIRVVDARGDATTDALIRRESIRLFGDSKRIEAIVPWVDVLLSSDLAPSGLSDDDVLAAVGLFREPQPFLIAGHGTAHVRAHAIPVISPYIGLPVESIAAFTLSKSPEFVLSIENKQTFHEAARLPHADAGVVIYTGGMPSPAWLRAYCLLLAALPEAVPCYHFGDLDLGGFRIATVIARAAAAQNRRLLPWGMSPQVYSQEGRALLVVPNTLSEAMIRTALALGWNSVAERLRQQPSTAEQEAIVIRLPLGEALDDRAWHANPTDGMQ